MILKGLLLVIISVAANSSLFTQAMNTKVKSKHVVKTGYVVLSAQADTIFGEIRSLSLINGVFTSFKLRVKNKTKTLTQTELQRIVGYSYNRKSMERGQIKADVDAFQQVWLNVLNSGRVRFLYQNQVEYFEDEDSEEIIKVPYEAYFWRAEDEFIPFTPLFVSQTLLPAFVACNSVGISVSDDAQDEAYLLQLTSMWNDHFACISLNKPR